MVSFGHPFLEGGDRIVNLMNQCDITVFVSHSTQRDVEIYSKTVITNEICIYNVFNYERIKLKSKLELKEDLFSNYTGKTFLSIGRLVYQKGYDVLLDAHIEILDEGMEHRIIIIGEGPDYEKLKNRIIREGVEKSFILLGQRENPYPYMVASDFYIQPSRYEVYPLAVGEALILNKPVLSTDSGGVREMLTHRKTGYIVDFTKDALKEGITTFLSDEKLVKHIHWEQKQIDLELHNRYAYEKIEKIFS